MFIIQLVLLMLSSIGIMSCSPKDESKPANTYQVRVLHETTPGVFQNRNIHSELNLKDIIYFDSNTSTIFNYDPKQEDENSLIWISTECSDSQKLITYQSSFKSQKFYIYQILPPQALSDILLKKSNWKCTIKSEFRPLGAISQIALFKSKNIIASEFETKENFLFATGSVPYVQMNLLESQFQSIYFSEMKPGNGIEMICETFSSHLQKKDNNDINLKDLTTAANIRKYTDSTLDPRLMQLKQSCLLRLSQKNKSLISNIYTVYFKSPKPNVSCPTPTRSFGVSQLQHVLTATYTNPFNFPITFAIRSLDARAHVNAKWEAGGSREGNGSKSETNTHFLVNMNIQSEFHKQSAPWAFIWLGAHQNVEVHIGLRPGKVHHLASIRLHVNQNFCTPFSSDKMLESFENVENLNIYEDPN